MTVELKVAITRIIHHQHLIKPGSTIVVAVSGGPDSIALLHVLASLRSKFHHSLVAVYVDHGLRPREIPSEIACVQQSAKSFGIPCEIIPVDTKDFAADKKISIEDAARRLRYQVLRKCAAKHKAEVIAVAHTADDQAEEVLLRLLRGSGRKGLAGMQLYSRDLIRPFLNIPKKQVLEYLDRHDLSFCHDSSNDDLCYLRNRVRHVLLPLLEKDFDPGVRGALRKTAENLREDEVYLSQCVEESYQRVVSKRSGVNGMDVFVLNRREFSGLHTCIQRRLIEHLLWSVGCPARYVHIMDILATALEGRNRSELHLSKGLRVGVTSETLEFSYPQGKQAWRGKLHDCK